MENNLRNIQIIEQKMYKKLIQNTIFLYNLKKYTKIYGFFHSQKSCPKLNLYDI